MGESDRRRWDRRYATPRPELVRKPPDPLLVRHLPQARNGVRALELACGLGHNARWLAGQGYTVDAIDISEVALHTARDYLTTEERGCVNFIVADLDEFALPHYTYDLVYAFRFLDRALFPAIRAHVQPDGLVIYATFNVRRLLTRTRPPFNTNHLLYLGELPSLFPGWTVLDADDDGDVSWFVGRKPASS